jgi:hypothetical protein
MVSSADDHAPAPARRCGERRVDDIAGVVKGAFMSLGVVKAPFTTRRMW